MVGPRHQCAYAVLRYTWLKEQSQRQFLLSGLTAS